jgi:hypothetical protein
MQSAELTFLWEMKKGKYFQIIAMQQDEWILLNANM